MNLVIFDVDGTLLDNLRSEDQCYSQALRECLGIRMLRTDWTQYEHVTDQGVAIEAFATAFGEPPPAEALAATIDYFVKLLAAAHHVEPIRCIAGAVEMLRDLPRRGWAIGVATGAWRRAAVFKLGAAGLPTDAFPMATSEDGPARTAIISAAHRRAEEIHRGPFSRVVAVGDGVWDVAAARALELPFIGVATGDRAQRLRDAGATTVLADFASIEAMVSALENARKPCGAVPDDG